MFRGCSILWRNDLTEGSEGNEEKNPWRGAVPFVPFVAFCEPFPAIAFSDCISAHNSHSPPIAICAFVADDLLLIARILYERPGS